MEIKSCCPSRAQDGTQPSRAASTGSDSVAADGWSVAIISQEEEKSILNNYNNHDKILMIYRDPPGSQTGLLI
jgi:hypothetical protein